MLTLLVGSGPVMVGAAHLHVHQHLEQAETHALDEHLQRGGGPAFETAAAAEHEHVVLVARPPQDRQFEAPELSVVELPQFVLATVIRQIAPTDVAMRWFVARQHGPPPPARAPPFA